MKNEMIYELNLRVAKQMMNKGIITKKEFHQFKTYLIEKYCPILPELLGE